MTPGPSAPQSDAGACSLSRAPPGDQRKKQS